MDSLGLYWGGGECYIWTGLQPNKCGGLKHKGLYWGGGGGALIPEEVLQCDKKATER